MVSTASSGASRVASAALLEGFSLEMTGKDLPALEEAASVLPPGTRVNVTFLGNEDLEMRLAAASAVLRHGLVPVPHLSARRLRSREQLVEFLQRLADAGVAEHVFCVGGDPAVPEGPFPDALSLIRSGLLAEHGVREVGVAGYPEGHPDIPVGTLWDHLEQKTAALAEQGLGQVVLTQFAFDATPVVDWVGAVRDRGIDAPIRIGTPGPAGVKRLLGFARRFGIGANAMVVKKYGFSLTNLIGTAGPDLFVEDLAKRLTPASGDVRLHLYTFGGLSATAVWARDHLAGR